MTGWLYRTPIDGSRPDMPHDEEVVLLFIDRFCEASEQETMALGARAASLAQSKPDRERLEKRYEGEVTSARAHLMAEDIDPPDRAQHRRVRAALLFIESYRELPLLAWPRMVLDSVVALEQAFVIFRQRHARMVERVIGHRTGTGGSSGVAYLDQTALKYRIFRDVWATRTLLVRQSALPPLKNAHPYAFACSPVHGES